MPVVQQTQAVLPPARPRMLLANATTAESAFPSFSIVSQAKPASVDVASASGNYGVIHTADFPGSVVTLMFGGTDGNNETGKARVLVVPRAVTPAPSGSGTEEYVAQWLADFDFTVSSAITGTAGGVLGGTGFFLADTITSTATTPSEAINVISPADNANPASVQISHNNAQYIIVLLHRNSSLETANALYMLG